MICLALDLGATRVKWATFNGDRISGSGTFPTPRRPEDILKHFKGSKPSTIAVAFAGFVHENRIAFSPNLPEYQGFPLSEFLSRETGARIILDNDANLFTLGEALRGAGREGRTVLGLTLGTGVGGGLVIEEMIYRGAGFALEPGHMIVDPNGPPCACGNRGCLEALIGEKPFCQRFGYESAKDAFDAKDTEAWDFYARWLGIGLANLVNILDPDTVLLGGGIAGAFELFEKTLKETLAANVVEWGRRKTELAHSALGGEAALWGGYFLAKGSWD